MIEAMERGIRRNIGGARRALFERQDDVEVPGRGADDYAQPLRIAGVEVDLGVMESEHACRQGQLHSSWGAARHDVAADDVPLELKVLHLSGDLGWRLRRIAECDGPEAVPSAR